MLVIAEAFTGALVLDSDVELRSFDRHRFILHVGPSIGPAESAVTQAIVRGAIDERAWREVIGAPRSQQWLP